MNNFCGFNFSVYCNVLVPSNAKNIANTQSLKIDAIFCHLDVSRYTDPHLHVMVLYDTSKHKKPSNHCYLIDL